MNLSFRLMTQSTSVLFVLQRHLRITDCDGSDWAIENRYH